jgi:hypothetical protein
VQGVDAVGELPKGVPEAIFARKASKVSEEIDAVHILKGQVPVGRVGVESVQLGEVRVADASKSTEFGLEP